MVRTERARCVLILLALLAGCSGAKQAATEGAANVKNAVSPVVGSWTINGDVPAPKPNLPQFVRLHFSADGKLDASYVAAGGALAGVVNTPTKLKNEHDSYTLGDEKTLSIIEGSRSLDFSYDVRDGKLFLTPKGQSEAMVYRHAGS